MVAFDEETALIVVDVQNDFADPAGSLYVAGGDAILGSINETVSAANASGAMVVYTQDWHPPSTPHFAKDGGIWPVHCVQDTWGAAFHPALQVEGQIVRKGTAGEDGYSGFTVRDPTTGTTMSTGLHEMLEAAGVSRIVVVGLATDYCVKETVLDGLASGLAVTVLSNQIRPVNLESGDGERAVAAMTSAGASVE